MGHQATERQVVVKSLRRHPGEKGLGLGGMGDRLRFIQIWRLGFVTDPRKGAESEGGESFLHLPDYVSHPYLNMNPVFSFFCCLKFK